MLVSISDTGNVGNCHSPANPQSLASFSSSPSEASVASTLGCRAEWLQYLLVRSPFGVLRILHDGSSSAATQLPSSPGGFTQRTTALRSAATASSPPAISIVCISDTHNTQPGVPDGDILLHAGDLTNRGSFEDLQAQLDWLKSLPHRYKVVIAGNHDLLLDPGFVANFPDRIYERHGTSRSDLDWGGIIYLNNGTASLELPTGRSLVVYGSPWTEQLGTWAFQYPPIRSVWADSVPLETDILLTHGPPKGHLDQEGKGRAQLLREIWRVRPKVVVFGHIHDGHGREDVAYSAIDAAYDEVMTGDKGIVAVCWMASLVLCRLLLDTLSLSRSFRRVSPHRYTTFVNAAAVTSVMVSSNNSRL